MLYAHEGYYRYACLSSGQKIYSCGSMSKRMTGIAYFDSPVGWLRIKAFNDALTELEFVDAAGEDTIITPVVAQTIQELEEYFTGERREFTVRIAPTGTSFQKQVWVALLSIPFGHTISYGRLARVLSNADAIRAVGQANHVNPIAIIIPCHRVIGSDRSLVGYGGGLWKKRWLLQHEQHIKEGTRTVPLSEFLSN